MSEEKLLRTIERLREIRAKEDLSPPPSKILRSHLPNGIELKLRQYQIQGILHLIAMPRFVLGDDTGLGKCVTGDTLISTDKGLLPIASLNPGVSEPDTFVPFDGDAQVVVRGETRRIRSFYYGGLKPTVKIRTRRGYEIEGSHIHPLLVRGEDGSEDWVKMSDLKVGDYTCLDRDAIDLPSGDGYFYDPIVEVSYGEAEVFDIEVDHPEHSFVGNGFVCHNTLQSIAALSYIWDKNPSIPALICTTKSAVGQWESEFDKFTHGVKVFKCLGTKKKREKIHNEFNLAEGPKVIIMGYRTAVQDFQYIQHMVGHVVIFDEATAFKNDTSQVHQVCKHMAGSAERVWSLSATIIKNRLMEAWAIYKVTVPHLFGAKTHFMREYCITRDQTIPGSRRRIQIVVGHRKRDIQAFREHIDAYFLGRPKHEVAQELPPLTTKIIECDLSKAQKNKYAEALQGLLEYLDPETGELAEREVSKLTAVTVCQQIVNHPALVDCEGDSGKLDTLLDLIENELEGEKIIVFSRFRGMVDILEAEINGKGVQTCRITGAESGDERLASQKAFQDPESDTKVCLITMAAAEGVNLQLAKAVVFYDTPWSAGDYLQIVGRMIRIGSIHDKVYSYHICAPKTIDDRVMKTLKAKMGLIEAVLGKRLKEDGESDAIVEVGQSELADIFDGLLEDAQDIIKVK
jgi:hypothetical protein